MESNQILETNPDELKDLDGLETVSDADMAEEVDRELGELDGTAAEVAEQAMENETK